MANLWIERIDAGPRSDPPEGHLAAAVRREGFRRRWRMPFTRSPD
jgi:hypothetical protein